MGFIHVVRAGLLLAALAPLGPGIAAERRPPAPHCLDARTVREVFQADERTLAVATGAGLRYRVGLGSDCPVEGRSARMLAEAGWVCGAGNEFVAVGETLCPVTVVARIGPAEYAAHARASYTSSDGTVTLPAVTVQGERRRGFAASANYCLDPRQVRGWSERPDGLLVEVNPRRSGGNRFYRVELARSCPQLEGGSAMTMRSGMGIGIVCGNPGDMVVSGTRMAGAPAGTAGRLQSGFEPLGVFAGRHPDTQMTGTDRLQALGARFGCPISAVYPVQG